MIISQKDKPDFRLKLIDETDLENLRVWKNKNKEYFFHQSVITKAQQITWYKDVYLTDKTNYMFVVEEKIGNGFMSVGCCGYRLKNDVVDVYNIMRGRKTGSEHQMSTAFMMMNAYIAKVLNYKITCVVLRQNPARSWYEKLGFEAVLNNDEYVTYELNKNKIPDFELEVQKND